MQVLAEGYSKALNFFSSQGQENQPSAFSRGSLSDPHAHKLYVPFFQDAVPNFLSYLKVEAQGGSSLW